MANNRPPRLGVIGVLVVDDRVLLVKQAYDNRYGTGKDKWWIPGGYVRADETLAAAAVRELREETGLITEAQGVMAVRARVDDVVVALKMKLVGGELKPDGHEVVDARFFTYEELQNTPNMMGLSRRIAEAALRGEHGLLSPDPFRPPMREPGEYTLYI